MAKQIEGQMNLFDMLNPKFCFDDDINDLKKSLDEMLNEEDVYVLSEKFEVWGHVPKLGFRYSVSVAFNELTERFGIRLDELTEAFKKRHVEVSAILAPYYGHHVARNGEEYSREIFLSTMFTDGRKKIRR